MDINNLIIISVFLLILTLNVSIAQTSSDNLNDSFNKLEKGFVLQTVDDFWKEYDPGRDPLNVKVFEQWEEYGVVCKVIRYVACFLKEENP